MDRTPLWSTTTSGRARAWIRAGFVTLLASWLGYVVLLAVLGPELSTVRDTVLYGLMGVVAFALVTARAVLVRRERAPWTVMAVALGFALAGMATFAIVSAATENPPYPTVADVFYLAVYPAWYIAVALLVRGRVRELPRSVWLDGVVALLAVGSLVGAWYASPVRDAGTAPVLQTLVTVAYPVADVILLVLAAFGLVLLGSRAPRSLWWLAAAMLVAGVADLELSRAVAAGDAVRGSWISFLWPLSRLLIAVAAWSHAPIRARPRPAVGVLLIAPAASLVTAVGVLVWASVAEVPPIAVATAAAALLGVLVRLARTVTDTARMMDAQRVAATDELTDLPNRRGFTTGAARVLDGAGPDRPAALLMMDLDGFKEVNDSLGHQAGDRLLIDLADRIRDLLRSPDDVLGRLGGDEFAFMLPMVDRIEAQQVAVRIAAALKPPFVIDGVRMQTSASIGIALVPEHGTDLALLLRRADIAMYRAKGGRGRHAIYEAGLDRGGEERLQRVADLRRAIDRGELVLHYQPKVRLPSAEPLAVEALVRWDRPGVGLVPPDAFLPLVEDAGLMPTLTAAVLDQALGQVAAWERIGLRIPVAVNLPAAAVSDPDLPDRIQRGLDRHGVRPAALHLEITEEALLRDGLRAKVVLARLRTMGVRIAIDDYGTGYSSLAYLRELTVDEVKLDKSFVQPMVGDERAAAIVRSTIDLAHALGLEIVAEGVEDEKAARELADYGCDAAQGYLWTRPLAPQAVVDWLARQTATTHQTVPDGV